MNTKKLVIAIDGPSAAGKSTIGKLLAKILDYIYIDTGAMYRAIALKLQQKNISLEDTEKIEKILCKSRVNFIRENDDLKTLLDGTDVSKQIRTPTISQLSSAASAIPIVRHYLVKMQQDMGKTGGVVMDGRDIGTVVFPNADCKFYLDASVKERAQRRFRELQDKGIKSDLDTVMDEMKQRDHNDSTRQHSPLRKADDAILIDSTDLGIEDVAQLLKKHIDKYLSRGL